MARKSTKADKVELLNIESIIKEIEKLTNGFSSCMKYDGITIELTVKDDITRTVAKNWTKEFCKQHSLKVYALEDNKDDKQKFILQFPDMVPVYTEDEKNKMFIDNFKWLLDDSLRNRPDLTKSFILDNTHKYVKLALTTYVRSNVNQYKEKLDDYLNDTLYRQNLNVLFMTYLDEYWSKRGK